MPSLVPGYEYDIFISYRQKDNKGDRWVTEFVNALCTELEATFKEDISIYFDENPHDGLLETHQVNESLASKLKCLIFIPIISQTFCDQRSFAWQNEFLAFNKLTKEDMFGREVKVSNGNVVSRILPIKIHDLDAGDKAMLESELGGFIRSIEFIYKSSGVNRPLLRHESHPQDNLNKTYYRDQINKVANAIKEIVNGIKNTESVSPVSKLRTDLSSFNPVAFIKNNRSVKKKWLAAACVLIITAGISYFYLAPARGLFKTKKVGIAILPFRDISGSEDHKIYGLGMASEVRTKLSESKHFDFISSMQATMPFVNTNLSPKQIGKELRVDYLLAGFYQVSGNNIKVEVELIDQFGNSIWSLPLQSELTDIFKTQSTIASQVLGKFSTERIGSSGSDKSEQQNLDAYTHYLKGNSILVNLTSFDSASYRPAIDQFLRAIALDSSYLDPWVGLVNSESQQVLRNPFDEKQQSRIRGYVEYVNHHFPDSWRKKLVNAYYQYRCLNDLDQGLALSLEVLKEDPENSAAISIAGAIYKRNLKHEKGIYYSEKELDLEPSSVAAWGEFAQRLQVMGDYENCLRAHLKKWELGAKNSSDILWIAVALGSLENIPLEIKTKADNEYTFNYYSLERNWKEVLKVARKSKDNTLISQAYAMMGKQDSSLYWGNQQVKALQSDDNAGDFEYTQAYAYAGNKEKAFEHLEKITWLKRPGTWPVCIKKHFGIWILIVVEDYKEATERLLKLNKEYPDWGDYGQFTNDPFYDKIKAKYPPFAEAVKNLKHPQKVELRKPIVLAASKEI